MNSEELYKHLLIQLHNKKPVSIIRCGDGEGIILSGHQSDSNYVLQRQLGSVPSKTDSDGIRSRLIEAYQGADIIGIPVKNRFLKIPESYWARVRGLLEENVSLEGKILTDIDFHAHFLERGYFDKLFKTAQKVFYVSCRNIQDSLFIKYDNLQSVQGYHIAPEMKFTGMYSGTPHLKDIENVKRWIASQNVRGHLCLFGAGVVGKIYGNWFRDSGGIALDIGSVFDSFAGLRTRGVGRGIDVEDKTFKL